jgi:transposase-like protein
MAQQGYSNEFKAEALARLKAEGWPDKEGAILKVSKQMGVPHQTLSRWTRGMVKDMPSSKEVSEAEEALADKVESELDMILKQMGLTRATASYKDLNISFGIMVDKLMVLRGKPNKRTAHEETVTVDDARKKLSDLLTRRAEQPAEGSTPKRLN